MAFSTRVFCRDATAPSLSEILVWLRQHEVPVTVTGGSSRNDLLSIFWDEVWLSYDPDEAPLVVRCWRADAVGIDRLTAEVADFIADVSELPESEAREQVLAQLGAARTLVLVEFPPEAVPSRAYEVSGWLMGLHVERCGGMVQGDGVGFYDEDDTVILPLS